MQLVACAELQMLFGSCVEDLSPAQIVEKFCALPLRFNFRREEWRQRLFQRLKSIAHIERIRLQEQLAFHS